jgi:hypothetical protein
LAFLSSVYSPARLIPRWFLTGPGLGFTVHFRPAKLKLTGQFWLFSPLESVKMESGPKINLLIFRQLAESVV